MNSPTQSPVEAADLADPAKLPQLLKDWPVGRTLLFADEAGGVPLAAVAAPAPAAILTGPEGGFTDEFLLDPSSREPPLPDGPLCKTVIHEGAVPFDSSVIFQDFFEFKSRKLCPR